MSASKLKAQIIAYVDLFSEEIDDSLTDEEILKTLFSGSRDTVKQNLCALVDRWYHNTMP